MAEAEKAGIPLTEKTLQEQKKPATKVPKAVAKTEAKPEAKKEKEQRAEVVKANHPPADRGIVFLATILVYDGLSK